MMSDAGIDSGMPVLRGALSYPRIIRHKTTPCTTVWTASASTNAAAGPSGTVATATTRQNSANPHIAGKNPRSSRIASAAPACACADTTSTANATGNVVDAPLSSGPRRSATDVTVRTTASVPAIRSGTSHAGGTSAGG